MLLLPPARSGCSSACSSRSCTCCCSRRCSSRPWPRSAPPPTPTSTGSSCPACWCCCAIFGGLFQGFGLIAELRAGVIERSRVTPISRLALLLGPIAAGRRSRLLAQAVIITLLALLLRAAGADRLPAAGVPAARPHRADDLVGVVRGGADRASEDALAPLMNTVAQPILLLSGILLPLLFAPAWLRAGGGLEPVLLGGRRHPSPVRRRRRQRPRSGRAC